MVFLMLNFIPSVTYFLSESEMTFIKRVHCDSMRMGQVRDCQRSVLGLYGSRAHTPCLRMSLM